MNKYKQLILKKLIESSIDEFVAINEQLVQPQTKDDKAEGNDQQTLVPLAPDQINKKTEEISNKFITNIFANVKSSLGPQYYDEDLDKLSKDVKIKSLLQKDFETFINKIINTVVKQPTGQEQPGVGVNKTNI